MPGSRAKQLQDDILAAFQRACRESRLDVAEHLLRALEVLCEQDSRDSTRGSGNLKDAYRAVARLGSCP